MNNQKLKSKSGISIIEILIYVFLLTIILGIVTNLFYQVANFRVNHQISSSLLQNSSLVMTKISHDIQEASSAAIPTSDTLTNNLVLGSQDGQISYQVVAGVLRRNGVDVTDSQVEVNVEPPKYGFRKVGNSVQVIISLKTTMKPFGQLPKEQVYQTTVNLRQP